MEREILTYSSLSSFRNCRKAYDWRYNQHLVPIDRDPNLSFGSVIHDALELWHREGNLDLVLQQIDAAYADREREEKQKANWHLAMAIMKAYVERYPDEDFKVVVLEKTFDCQIINPDTGASSRTFVLKGKVDGILKRSNQHLLLEHKTAGVIDAGYLDRLWHDFQIILYSLAIEKSLGIRIDGVVYNIIAKSRLQQSKGETEAEFEQRRAELAAKNKSGKSNAQRKESESDEEFQNRLAEWYAKPDAFIRQELIISRDKLEEVELEIWELTQTMLAARRRGVWYKNTSQCFVFRQCAYFPLCSSGGNPNITENFYQHRPPFEELKERSENNTTQTF